MIIPPGFLSASYELQLTGFSRSAFITMGHENNTGANDPVAIAEALLDVMITGTSFDNGLDSNVVMRSCTVRLGQDGGEPIVGVGTGSTPGSLSSASPPANVAVLVHKRTAAGGRRNRGRLFLPWYVIETNVQEDGTIDSGTVSGMNGFMAGWRNEMITANLPPVLLHSVGQTIAPAPTPITSLTVDNLVSTQRRRLGRR